jgi:hypothetical protein
MMIKLVRQISNSFTFVLVTLIWMLLIVPLDSDRQTGEGSGWVFSIVLRLVLLACVFRIYQRPRERIVPLILILPGLVGYGIGVLTGDMVVRFAALSFDMLFLIYVTIGLTAHFAKLKEVNFDVFAGAVSVYMLIAVIFAVAFSLTESFQAGSFSLPDHLQGGALGNHFDSLFYFSFVTLTTLGYGDIAPVSDTARTLVIVEAIIGQLFIGGLIGRLVGLSMSKPKVVNHDS